DLIRLNYSGPLYMLDGDRESDPNGIPILKKSGIKFIVLEKATKTLPLPPKADDATNGWQTPFQVFRQPVKSAGTPVSLPAGTIIDLAFSGTGSNELFTSGNYFGNLIFEDHKDKPLVILFNRTGGVESISLSG